MEKAKWLSSLEPGTKVCIHSWGWSGDRYRIGTVDHITPTGFINVDGTLYKKSGEGRNCNAELLDPNAEETAKKVAKWKAGQLRKTTLRRMQQVTEITVEQAEQVRKIMGWEDT